MVLHGQGSKRHCPMYGAESLGAESLGAESLGTESLECRHAIH